jgi:hypothetical protein
MMEKQTATPAIKKQELKETPQYIFYPNGRFDVVYNYNSAEGLKQGKEETLK